MDCNIRNVPRELMAKMKGEAVRQGKTLREWAIWVWEAQFEEGGGVGMGKKAKEVKSGGMKGGGEIKEFLKEMRKANGVKEEEEVQEEKRVRCPGCGSEQVADWGRTWKCNQCKREWGKRGLTAPA